MLRASRPAPGSFCPDAVVGVYAARQPDDLSLPRQAGRSRVAGGQVFCRKADAALSHEIGAILSQADRCASEEEEAEGVVAGNTRTVAGVADALVFGVSQSAAGIVHVPRIFSTKPPGLALHEMHRAKSGKLRIWSAAVRDA